MSELSDQITKVLRELLSLDDFDGDQLYEGTINPRELAYVLEAALQQDQQPVREMLGDTEETRWPGFWAGRDEAAEGPKRRWVSGWITEQEKS